MSTRLEEKKRKFILVLLPDHKPIWFDMAFPLSLMVSF